MLVKFQHHCSFELKDMEFLVTLGLLSNSLDSKAISEFFGHDSLNFISKLNTNIVRHKIYISCLKMMIFRWWKNAPRIFLKFLSTNEHNRCKIHLSPSSLRMFSNRSILISLSSQVEPRCALLNAYTHLFFNLEAIHQLPMAM
jgi:hypothetical protein